MHKYLPVLIVFFACLGPVLCLGAEGTCTHGNCIDGSGEMKYPDGKIYTGEFNNGMREGQGKLLFTNGEVYTGGFSKDEPNGFGVHTYPTGEEYRGEIKNSILAKRS